MLINEEKTTAAGHRQKDQISGISCLKLSLLSFFAKTLLESPPQDLGIYNDFGCILYSLKVKRVTCQGVQNCQIGNHHWNPRRATSGQGFSLPS